MGWCVFFFLSGFLSVHHKRQNGIHYRKKNPPKQTKKHPSAQVLFDSAANCCHGYVKESLGLLPMGEVGGANSGVLPFKGKGAETGCQTDMVRHQKPCLFG